MLEMTKRSMSKVLLQPPLPQGTIVVATDDSCKRELSTAGASFFAWPKTTGECVHIAQLAYRSRQVVWLSTNAGAEEAMLFPTEFL